MYILFTEKKREMQRYIYIWKILDDFVPNSNGIVQVQSKPKTGSHIYSFENECQNIEIENTLQGVQGASPFQKDQESERCV